MERDVRLIGEQFGNTRPVFSIILGSAWGKITELFDPVATVNYPDISCMGPSSVKGHAGRLTLAKYGSCYCLVFEGRHHLYEGLGWDSVVFPVILSRHLGTKFMILTNAAGGIRSDLNVGDLMLISDHINMMGSSPLPFLREPGEDSTFPDQGDVYSKRLRKIFLKLAENLKENVTEGVYLGTMGPEYETPAEVRAFAKAGADAVGMSTVPEAITANAMKIPVLAISLISNMAAGISTDKISHGDVTGISRKTSNRMKKLIDVFLKNMSAKNR